MSHRDLAKSATLAIALLVGAAACPESAVSEAKAGEMRSISLYPQHQELSDDPMYRWAGAVKRVDYFDDAPTVITYASAVLIAPDLYITSGHFTPRNNSQVAFQTELVFGSNYHTSTDRWEIESTKRFPGYVFGDTTTIDLGIGWTKDFVKGFDTPVEFASVVDGDILTIVEFGNFGDMTTGQLPSVGDRLGGRAEVANRFIGPTVNSDYPPGTYIATYLPSIHFGPPLGTRGLNGASGSPWFTADGRVAGISIATTGGPLVGDGTTTILNLMDPEVQSFLQPYIEDSWARFLAVPEPSSLALSCGAGAVVAVVAARRKTRKGWPGEGHLTA